MRFAVASALVVLALAFTPGSAEAANSFGGFFCPSAPIPCNQGDSNFPSIDSLTALGNACLTKNLGISPTNGFFDQEQTLDTNGCLTTNADAFPMTNNGRAAPHCCIIQSPAGQCALYCTMSG